MAIALICRRGATGIPRTHGSMIAGHRLRRTTEFYGLRYPPDNTSYSETTVTIAMTATSGDSCPGRILLGKPPRSTGQTSPIFRGRIEPISFAGRDAHAKSSGAQWTDS